MSRTTALNHYPKPELIKHIIRLEKSLKEARQDLALSQRKLARRLGIDRDRAVDEANTDADWARLDREQTT